MASQPPKQWAVPHRMGEKSSASLPGDQSLCHWVVECGSLALCPYTSGVHFSMTAVALRLYERKKKLEDSHHSQCPAREALIIVIGE